MTFPIEQTLTDEWLDRLHSSGYRLTGPRRAIVEIIASSQKTMDPYDVFDQGRKDYPGLGLVTVYRTLERLEELALVTRVHRPDGCHAYLRASHGHQHILLCTGCGKAEYFSGDDLAPLFDSLSDRSGYAIKEHLLQVYGVCGECQKS
jgi:Fur family ferric uptake transcriptional regulator